MIPNVTSVERVLRSSYIINSSPHQHGSSHNICHPKRSEGKKYNMIWVFHNCCFETFYCAVSHFEVAAREINPLHLEVNENKYMG